MPPLQHVSIHDSVNQFDATTFQPIEQLINDSLGQVFPAIAITVIKEGDVLLNHAWGHIDLRADKPWPVRSSGRSSKHS